MVDNTASPPQIPSSNITYDSSFNDVKSYLINDLFNYLTNLYKTIYLIWEKVGGYNDVSLDVWNIKVKSQHINTLTNIDTSKTVQYQLDLHPLFTDLGSMAFQNSSNVIITGGSINNCVIIGGSISSLSIDSVAITNSSFSSGTISSCALSSSTISNSAISDGTIEDTNILVDQGSSSANMEVGGVARVDTTTSGNVGASETDLITYTLPANSLDDNGSFLEIEVFGTFASNANNKRVKLYLGSNVLFDTTSIAANAGSWRIKSTVVRVTSSSQKSITTIISDNVLVTEASSYTTPNETLTSDVVIKCTGQATSDNDVVQEGLIVKMFNG